MRYFLIGLSLVLLTSTFSFAQPNTTAKSLNKLEAKIEQLQRALDQRPRDVSTYRLPKTLKFCGRTIDLSHPVIRDRLEHEFYLILGDRAQVVLWARRAKRVFPSIERTIKRRKMCDDLKYLAVAESGLRAAVTSHASARGWWQFMAPTGRDFGLKVGRAWDERADLGQSTSAGLRYLEELHSQFGSWPLAMAAYNTGPGRLRRAIRDQGINDYWRLTLINEAERYVPRIVMIKEILGNSARYGFHLDDLPTIKFPKQDLIRLSVARGAKIPVESLARKTGIDLRELKRLNPELGTKLMPTGHQFVLAVPKGKGSQVKRWLRDSVKKWQVAEAKRRKKRRRNTRGRLRHKVRSGDSLWSIAKKYSISVAKLRKLNGLSKKSMIRPGRRLVVR